MINESNETLITNDIIMIEYDNGNIFRIKVSFWDIFLLVKRGTSPTYGDFELGKSSLHVFLFANKPCLISGGYFLGDSQISAVIWWKVWSEKNGSFNCQNFCPSQLCVTPPLLSLINHRNPGTAFWGVFMRYPLFRGVKIL